MSLHAYDTGDMMLLRSRLAVLSALLGFTFADNSFIAPPESTATIAPSNYRVYSVGSTLPISWTDNFGRVNLIINQVGSPSTQIDYLPDSTDLAGSAYNWPIRIDGTNKSPKFDLFFSNQFNFLLYETGATAPFAQSVTFNISNATVDAVGRPRPSTSSVSLTTTTSASSSGSSSVSASSSRSSTGSSSITSLSNPGQTNITTPIRNGDGGGDGGLSTGAKAGIGVGVGLGVVVVGLVVFAIIWARKRKVAKQETPTPAWAVPDQSGPTTGYPPSPGKYAYESVPPNPPPQELHENYAIPELQSKERPQQRYELQ